ncbi:hypothetical protein ROHU_001525 [Labeo rohita]|uniref:ribonuclease H n=1 Tax=Labeo rohita TaxID=84645 RepID=A0A498P370_LABRO|nr:hypothetical protein ROHU_001525 [Labeo rohita]
MDDILVFGASQTEHDQRLFAVLKKLQKGGVTLNQKCEFSKKSVKFLGQILDESGVQADPEKVWAITHMSEPTNTSEMRRFMDLSQRKSSVLLEVLKLQTQKKQVNLSGCSEEESEVMSFIQCLPYISQLRLSGYMVVRAVQALRSMKVRAPITVNKLTLDMNVEQQSERNQSILLRLWTVQSLNLMGCKIQSVSVSVLLCHQGPVTLSLSDVTLQMMVECVYEAQEDELTECFLQKVGDDLTFCSLSWKEFHYFLQHGNQQNTVNLRYGNIQVNIREILPFLSRIKFECLSSVFMLCVIREIYESGSAGFVSGLLSSVENYINLQCRDLDSVHCDALRFTLQHCTAASLNLQWTSIPEEELESILPLFTHVSHLSVDRWLLLKMLHCCSVSDVQQEAASVLLSILQHKLDFSCRSALDLTTNTDSEPLHLTADDCRATSRVIQRDHSDTKTQLILQDCEIHTAGMDELFPVLHSVQLCCDKSLLLQFLAHVRPEEAESLSGALGEELDLSQTQLDPQVCRGLVLILEYCEGLTELDLSQCRLTDHSLDLLLPNLHKVQNIDGNNITDAGAQKIHSIVTRNSNIKTVRLFNNRIESREIFSTDPRFEIC